jgi:cobalt/nickel transport system permease protein
MCDPVRAAGELGKGAKMHIPDGFIDTKTALATAAFSGSFLAYCLHAVRREISPRRVPLIGLAAAFVFAAQMINFPVAGGTSGHLIGAAFVAILLGPEAAVIVMSAVLLMQCFMFADGGVTALGANILNMAVVAPFAGYGIYKITQKLLGTGSRNMLLAMSFAAWSSAVIASIACALELSISGMAPWPIVFKAMAGIHMIIGAGEAVITTMIAAAIWKTRPEIFTSGIVQNEVSAGFASWVRKGVFISIAIAVLLAPLACAWPDGLEKAAAILGFDRKSPENPLVPSPFADYATPGIGAEWLSTAIAGAFGTILAFLLSNYLAGMLTRPRSPVSPGQG